MADFYSANRHLTEEEMKVNALYIYGVLTSWGWSAEAIAGMLGNMQTESTINPGIWEDLTVDTSKGFGLVQWTPATKYLEWCGNLNYEPSDMMSALHRIEFEVSVGEQWISTESYPMTFEEFKISKGSPTYLADVFLKNYERPADQNQPNRGTQAEKWYTYITGHEPVKPEKKKGMDLLMLILVTNRG